MDTGIWRIKAKVRDLYESSKYCYLGLYREEQTAKYSAIANRVKHLKFNAALDAGCGPGFYTETISSIARLYVGLDLCRGFIKLARDAHKHLGNVEFVVGDIDNPPFKDNSFDLVIAVTLLQNQPNPLSTLSKLTRLAKGNGIIAVTFLKKMFTVKDVSSFMESLKLIPTYIDDSTADYIVICRKTNPPLDRFDPIHIHE
jgi:ubiquinone/menaquinone biosynthesis C-methylase UbiE